MQLVIPQWQPGRQQGLGIQLQLLAGAVLVLHLAAAVGREVARQVQRLVLVDRQQWRQVTGIVGFFQGLEAVGDGDVVGGRVAKGGQDAPQDRFADTLGAPVGVDPVHRQASAFGQLQQG
ncbi:hypothetical protein D3C77_619160 [compost metagenome]